MQKNVLVELERRLSVRNSVKRASTAQDEGPEVENGEQTDLLELNNNTEENPETELRNQRSNKERGESRIEYNANEQYPDKLVALAMCFQSGEATDIKGEAKIVNIIGNQELTRTSGMASLIRKKVREKIQEKCHNEERVFQTYLVPSIEITAEEHQNALQRFYTRQNQSSALKEGQNGKMNSGAIYTFSINNYKRKKRKEEMGFIDYFLSEPLKCFDRKLCLKINLNKRVRGNALVSVKMCAAPEEGAGIDLPNYPHRRTIVIESSCTPILFVDEPPFGQELGRRWANELYFRPKTVSHKLIERGDFLLNNSMQIKLIIEPIYPLIDFFVSNNGVLLWEIKNFRQKLREEKDGVTECQHSSYFYTHETGYRMKVRLYLNGAGPATGSHLSVFLDFLVGQWDEQLPESLAEFPHITIFRILDQSDNETRRDIVRKEINNRGFGTGDFFYNFDHPLRFQEDVHLKNDTLLLQVVVEPTDAVRPSAWRAPFVAPPKPPLPLRFSKTQQELDSSEESTNL